MHLPRTWSEAEPDLLVNRSGDLVQIKRGASGLRDLNASLLQTAIRLRSSPSTAKGLLAIHVRRASIGGVRDAWDRARDVLDPSLARRISLAAYTADGRWTDAPSDAFGDILDPLAVALATEPPRVGGDSVGLAFFDVAKVLLAAWLLRRGPLRVRTIMAQVGCSAPTVIAALRELDARGEIERTKSRSVELRRLPRQTLDELVLRADRLRRTRWFVDRSGRANPEALLRRLTRAKLDGFAFGGVPAARHYDPALDVLGLPRIDVSLHTARPSKFDAELLTRIDPALAEVSSSKSEPILVVHSVTRAESLFTVAHGFPFADPAEVLVDLLELHLGAQAADFIKSLRKVDR